MSFSVLKAHRDYFKARGCTQELSQALLCLHTICFRSIELVDSIALANYSIFNLHFLVVKWTRSFGDKRALDNSHTKFLWTVNVYGILMASLILGQRRENFTVKNQFWRTYLNHVDVHIRVFPLAIVRF